MKISNLSQSYQVYQKQRIQKSERIERPVQQSLDIQISDKGREFQFAMEKLKQVPEVRKEKVEAISEQIRNGTYQVDTFKLAKAIKSYLSSNEVK